MGTPSISAKRPNAALERLWSRVQDLLPEKGPRFRPSINKIVEEEQADPKQDHAKRAATVTESLTNDPNNISLQGIQYIFEDFFIARENNGNIEFKVNDNAQILLHENRDQIISALGVLAQHSLEQKSSELIPTANGDKARNDMALQILNGYVDYARGNRNWLHPNLHVKPIIEVPTVDSVNIQSPVTLDVYNPFKGAFWTANGIHFHKPVDVAVSGQLSARIDYKDHVNIPVVDILASEQNSTKHFQAIAALADAMTKNDTGDIVRVNFNKSFKFKLNGIERTYNQNSYNKQLFPYRHKNHLGTQIKGQLLKSLQDICTNPVLRLQRERDDVGSMDRIYKSIGWGLTNFIPENEYGEFAEAAVDLIQTVSTDTANFNQRHDRVVKIIKANAEEIHQLEKAYEEAQAAQSKDPEDASLLRASKNAEEALRTKTQEVEASYQFFGKALDKFEDIDVKSLFLSKLLGENNKDHNGLAKLIGIDPDELRADMDLFIDNKRAEATEKVTTTRERYEALINEATDTEYEAVINAAMNLDDLDIKYPPGIDLGSFDESSIQTLALAKREQKAEIEVLAVSKSGTAITINLDSQNGIKSNIISLERELAATNDPTIKEENTKLIDLLNSYRDFHEIARLDAKIESNSDDLDLINSYSNRHVSIETARNEYNQAKEDLNQFNLDSYKHELEAEFLEDRTQAMQHESYRFITSINPSEKQMDEIYDNLFDLSELYDDKATNGLDFDLLTEKISIYLKKLLEVLGLFGNEIKNTDKETTVSNEQ